MPSPWYEEHEKLAARIAAFHLHPPIDPHLAQRTMPTPQQKLVQISQEGREKTLSPAQKRFNRLIKNIEKERQCLSEWHDWLPLHQARAAAEYTPLIETHRQHRKAMAMRLGQVYDAREIKRAERKKLRHLIVTLAHEMLEEEDDEDLKTLYNRLTASDYDAEQQEADAASGEIMRAMFEGMFGIELGDDADLSSPEKAEAALREQMEKLEEQERQREQRAEERRKKRKKTAKQIEREAREQDYAQHVTKSIQDIFRKLVASLHPDREPDPDERARKTELMQRVNVAYDKRDLLELIELQLQVEQIDQHHIDNIAEDRLEYFNQVLKERYAELQRESMQLVNSIATSFNLPSHTLMTPKSLTRRFERDLKELKRAINGLERDLKSLQTVGDIKAWLSDYTVPRDEDTLNFFGPF